MSARYPEDLVRRPFPQEYDLQILYPPLVFTDEQHEIARTIFNRRTARAVDLDDDDVQSAMDSLDVNDQVQVVLALFFMFGSKVGAIQRRLGIS